MNVRSNKREIILESAIDLFSENGLHNTPMSKISKYSKVSIGAIYNYFPSKEELINYLFIELEKEKMDLIFTNYSVKDSYKDRFFLIIKNYFKYLIAYPKKFSFLEQCSSSPLIKTESKNQLEGCMVRIRQFVLEGIRNKHIKEMDIELIFAFVNGIIVNIAKLELSTTLKITEPLIQFIANCCWNGLKES